MNAYGYNNTQQDFKRFSESCKRYTTIEAQDDNILHEAVLATPGTVEVLMYTYHTYFLKVVNPCGNVQYYIPGYFKGLAHSQSQAERILFDLFIAETPQLICQLTPYSIQSLSKNQRMKNVKFYVFTLNGELLPVRDAQSNLEQVQEVLKIELTAQERAYWQDFKQQLEKGQKYQRNWVLRVWFRIKQKLTRYALGL